MEKFKKTMATLSLLLVCVVSLTGCIGNSGNLTDGFTNASNTFNYVLTCEAGVYRLHAVGKWKDGDSDALGITTKCCENQFWTSYNSAVLYTEFPEYLPENVVICGQEK